MFSSDMRMNLFVSGGIHFEKFHIHVFLSRRVDRLHKTVIPYSRYIIILI